MNVTTSTWNIKITVLDRKVSENNTHCSSTVQNENGTINEKSYIFVINI